MKKLLSFALVMLTLLTLAACKPAKNEPDGGTTAAATSADTTGAPEIKALDILIVTSPSGIDDNGFNQNIYTGICEFTDARGGKVTHARDKSGIASLALAAVSDNLAGHDVVVCCGTQFAGLSDIAKANTDKKFILIDAYPTDADGKEISLENVCAVKFSENESGFLIGVAAALESASGKVASVHGYPYQSNINYQTGFAAGVDYANDNLGTKTELVVLEDHAGITDDGKNVGGNYVGGFDSPDRAYELARKLIAAGCDTIFASSGNSNAGVRAAALETDNVMIMGSNFGNLDDNAKRDPYLTSTLKKTDVAVKSVLSDIADGKFEGGNRLLTIKDGAVGYVSEEGQQNLKKETLETLAGLYDKIVAER